MEQTAMKTVLYASKFYGCKTKQMLSAKATNRISILYDVINSMGTALTDGKVAELYNMIRTGYQDNWFAYDYVKNIQQEDDCKCLDRFVSFLGNARIISGSQPVCIETSRFKILSSITFIAESNGIKTAYIVFPKKADKSPYGKSVHTCSETDIFAMSAKASLENAYPGINIALVYLFNDDDALGKVSQFKDLKTKKSNIFRHDYSEYYDEGRVFSFEAFLGKLDSVAGTKTEPNCFNCDCKDLCQENTLCNASLAKARPIEGNSIIGYEMPVFTDTQQKVIDKVDGPLLVCAGPGSGKTATLVGRIKHLIDCGVDPEFILAITFTREAAGELKERCLSFCEPYSMPEIMTLNALGYSLLKLNPEYVGNVQLLTSRQKLMLISRLLEVTPPLEGFNYSIVTGNTGLLAKVSKSLDELAKGNSASFKPDFLSFADTYFSAIKQNGYISYDEQITLAQNLFDEHPEILDSISSRYKFIMVDEFQDIDAAQAKFIFSLSQKYRNLCCVGDDDQSIYAFRGGNNEYMLSFRKLYPEAEVFTLKENFRSSEKIFNSAQKVVMGNKRIKKEIRPVKKGGIEPVVITGQSASHVEDIVNALVKNGISYDDIAVIASKNQTLELLQRDVAFPSILGKEYVTSNPYFKILLFVLKMHYDKSSGITAEHLDRLIGDSVLSESIIEIPPDIIAAAYCDEIAKTLGLSDSAVKDAVDGLISKNHIRSTLELYELCHYMAEYGDETRIEPNTDNAVIFITAHESKGMEWKAVLLIDDFRDEGSEEQNRVIYVAMTRSEDYLYILEREGRNIIAA